MSDFISRTTADPLPPPSGHAEGVARLDDVFARLPAAIAVLRGPEHRFELANDAYHALAGRREFVGKTVREAIPEVESQGFVDLLDAVYTTGEPYRGDETPVLLDRDGNGELHEAFVNFVYLPIRNGGGEVDGILVHAVEVTELVNARRTVEGLANDLTRERRRLETLVDQMPTGVVMAEVPSGRLLAANKGWRDFFGVSVDTVGNIEGYGVFAALHPDGRTYDPAEYPLARSVATGEVVVAEPMVITRADGDTRIIEVNSTPLMEDGQVEAGVATFSDVTDQRRAAMLIARNKALLEVVAAGAPLEETLENVAAMIEEHAGGDVLASILLLDRDGVHLRHGAAPSLPAPYNEAIDGIAIGPAVGSCGTAAFTGQPVVVSDIEHDPLWADFKDLALTHGLRACWSTPIISSHGDVLGTFAIYSRETRGPDPREQDLVDIATRTAAIAVERRRLEEDRERLFAAERDARSQAERSLRVVEALHRVGQAINASLDLQQVVQVVTDAATELSRAAFGAFFYNAVRADGEAYTLYTLSGAPRSAFEKFPMPRNTKIFAPTFSGTEVVRLDDVLQDERYGLNAPYHGMPEGHLPVRSYLAAPVASSDGEVLGGLFFGHPEPGVFTEEAERMVVGIAAQAAVAIERARLYVREQQAHAEAERRAAAALSLEHVNDAVCLVDLDGIVRVWNPAAASIVGVPASEAVGRPFAEAVPALAAAAATVPIIDAPETGGRTRTVPVAVADRELWLAISGIRFPSGIVYTFRDRSDERRLEQMRSDIIATVSHELRTPLAAVYGAARTLARNEVLEQPELRNQFVEMIESETERLNRVVDQILQTSRIDPGATHVSTAPVDIEALVRHVAALAALRPDAVPIEVRPGGGIAIADEDKLQQVLLNLIDNAIKYAGDGGRVVVAIDRRGDRLLLSVTDFGAGIPVQEAERIFDRFYRLDPQQRRGVAGTGLGLHISRELIRAMDGDLWVQPNVGENGSTFVAELPSAAE